MMLMLRPSDMRAGSRGVPVELFVTGTGIFGENFAGTDTGTGIFRATCVGFFGIKVRTVNSSTRAAR